MSAEALAEPQPIGKRRLKLITTSMARAYRACMRLGHIKYALGYRSARVAETLRVGSAVHKGLEAWWLARAEGIDRMEAVAAAIERLEDPFDQALCCALMAGYEARWGGDGLKTLYEEHPQPDGAVVLVPMVERKYVVPLVNPETGSESRTWEHGGMQDVLVEDLAARRWVVEHKTTSEDIGAGSEYWQRLKIDNQVSQYISAARAQGIDVVGCIYDVIKKPKSRPLKATPMESRKYKKGTGELYAAQRDRDETPDEYGERVGKDICANPDKYYQRGEVVNLEHDCREAAGDLWSTAKMIHDSERQGFIPRNPDACMRWGRACDFFACCTGSATLQDETLYRKLDDVHEELKENGETT